jgi:hypothetical protein
VHIKNRPKLDKVLPRAFISWLVGYESTNIYRIWSPSQKRIVCARDVTFDPSKRYKPDEEEDPNIEEIIKLIEVPSFKGFEGQLYKGNVLGLPIPKPLQSFERSVDDFGDTIIVNMP